MNKSLLSLLALAAAGTMCVSARQLTPTEATSRVPATLGLTTLSRASVAPAYTLRDAELNVAYVFQRAGDGFVIVAADDLMPAVLGYTDSGSFDEDNLPPALEYWLGTYSSDLRYATENGATMASSRSKVLSNVDYLCATKWNQGAPYNNNTPRVGDKATYTGCTCTAFAQVVGYHKFPAQGHGSHTYTSWSIQQELTYDFDAHPFDWANMCNTYYSGYTDEQAAAVANLMEAVGNISYMDYNTNASGAWPYNTLYGLVNYMDYDRSAWKAERNFFPIDQWCELLHGELVEGRPIPYSGGNSEAGHCFVIDGYKDGYFHVNWGWGGTSDGYFLITGLDPANQGIGGSSAGYNVDQDAVIGLKPSDGSASRLNPVLYASGPLAAGKLSYGRDEWVEIKMQNGGMYGFTLEDIDILLGFNVTPVDGGETVFYPGVDYYFKSYFGTSFPAKFTNMYVSAQTLPTEGQYYVSPAFKYNDEVKSALTEVGRPSAVLMTCSADAITFSQLDVKHAMTVESLDINKRVFVGKKVSFDFELSNDGDEYYDRVRIRLYDKNGTFAGYLGYETESGYEPLGVLANVAPGHNDRISMTGLFFKNTKLTPAGTYDLYVADINNRKLTMKTPVEVVIGEAAEGDCHYKFKVTVDGNYEGTGKRSNPYIVDDELRLKFNVDVTDGFFDCNVHYWGFYLNDDNQLSNNGPNLGNGTSYDFVVNAGESEEHLFVLNTSAIPDGTKAVVWPYVSPATKNNISANYYTSQIYVIRSESGIKAVEAAKNGIFPTVTDGYATIYAESAIEAIEIYSVYGALEKQIAVTGETEVDIDATALAAGCHIVVVKTADGETTSYKLIRR